MKRLAIIVAIVLGLLGGGAAVSHQRTLRASPTFALALERLRGSPELGVSGSPFVVRGDERELSFTIGDAHVRASSSEGMLEALDVETTRGSFELVTRVGVVRSLEDLSRAPRVPSAAGIVQLGLEREKAPVGEAVLFYVRSDHPELVLGAGLFDESRRAGPVHAILRVEGKKAWPDFARYDFATNSLPAGVEVFVGSLPLAKRGRHEVAFFDESARLLGRAVVEATEPASHEFSAAYDSVRPWAWNGLEPWRGAELPRALPEEGALEVTLGGFDSVGSVELRTSQPGPFAARFWLNGAPARVDRRTLVFLGAAKTWWLDVVRAREAVSAGPGDLVEMQLATAPPRAAISKRFRVPQRSSK